MQSVHLFLRNTPELPQAVLRLLAVLGCDHFLRNVPECIGM
jgi:predicted secreted protein